MTILSTREIMQLALEKGEITSTDVVSHLVGSHVTPGEYRNLLAQASTLLGRLHSRGELRRRWIRRNRGCYLYVPSESAIDSLLPLLGVLEERKRRKQIEEVLAKFTKRLVLELRLETQIIAILWNPGGQDRTDRELSAEIWIVVTDRECEDLIQTEAEEASRGTVGIEPVLIQVQEHGEQVWERIPQQASVLYGWSQIPPEWSTSPPGKWGVN